MIEKPQQCIKRHSAQKIKRENPDGLCWKTAIWSDTVHGARRLFVLYVWQNDNEQLNHKIPFFWWNHRVFIDLVYFEWQQMVQSVTYSRQSRLDSYKPFLSKIRHKHHRKNVQSKYDFFSSLIRFHWRRNSFRCRRHRYHVIQIQFIVGELC